MADINRSELRKIIMTALYQISVYKSTKIKYDTNEVIKELLEVKNDFVNEILFGVLEHEDELVDIANKNLKDWTIDRLGKTDQAILKIGLYELLYTDTPDIVCINEALDLASEYSDDKVKSMINAVLDNVMKNKD